MMNSIPDVCETCGYDDLDVKVKRSNANGGSRLVSINCENCGEQIADRQRLNYKSPVMEETDE